MTGRAAGIGAALATLSLPVHFFVDHGTSVELAALTLASIAAIYVGFALIDGRPTAISLEVVVALLYIGAAALGLWLSAWFIPAAIAVHAAWDVAHHRSSLAKVPSWYVPFCAVFDVVFASGLSLAWAVNTGELA